VHDLSPEQSCCPTCGEAFAPFPGAEESTIIEVQVQAHLRRIHRRRYQKMCRCPQVPGLVTAPPAPRVIPKSPLGVSLWTTVLLDKYLPIGYASSLSITVSPCPKALSRMGCKK